jgi:hypothetical protein
MNKYLIIAIYIISLIIIGLSIDKRWGDYWGYIIPLLFMILSVRWVLKLFNKKDEDEDNYDEEVDSVVIRGRD